MGVWFWTISANINKIFFFLLARPFENYFNNSTWCTLEGSFFPPFGAKSLLSKRKVGWGGIWFFCICAPKSSLRFSMILPTCSTSSQCVNPQDVPNNTTHYPICFAQSWTFITYKVEPNWKPSTLLFWGLSGVSKKKF